jgi:DNA-binding transcriptional regulator YiaG
MPAGWRFEHLIHLPGSAGMGGGVTIAPDGRVYPDLRTTDPGPQGQPATFIRHLDVLDEMTAAFLRHRGHGHRLVPLALADLAEPRSVAARIATPQVVKDWATAEVAAGRLLLIPQLPPPETRRQLRESAGLSRPAVAARLGVSGEALRLWEEGLREPQGTNRDAYLQMLASWGGGTQEPALELAEPKPVEPEPEPESEPGFSPWSDPQRRPGEQPGRTQHSHGGPAGWVTGSGNDAIPRCAAARAGASSVERRRRTGAGGSLAGPGRPRVRHQTQIPLRGIWVWMPDLRAARTHNGGLCAFRPVHRTGHGPGPGPALPGDHAELVVGARHAGPVPADEIAVRLQDPKYAYLQGETPQES